MGERRRLGDQIVVVGFQAEIDALVIIAMGAYDTIVMTTNSVSVRRQAVVCIPPTPSNSLQQSSINPWTTVVLIQFYGKATNV